MSLFKWIKIIFYMFFYYTKENNITSAIKKFAKKTINVCGATVNCQNKINLSSFVIMATHKSYFDIFCLEYCFEDKHIIWFAKKELFKIPLFGKIFAKTGALEIDRENPIKSALAIRRLLKNMKNNVVFVIFPYGTRRNTLNFKSGGIFFAKKLKLPIIPVKIENSDVVMPPGKIKIKSANVNVVVYDAIDFNSEEKTIETKLKELI